MADVQLGLALAAVPQSTPGTFDPVLAADTALGLPEGLILGDGESGTGNTGITLSTEGRYREKPPIPGDRTQPDPFFVQEDLSDLTFIAPMSGNRSTLLAAPIANDFDPNPGMATLLTLGGMVLGTVDATGTEYLLGNTALSSVMVYDRGNDTIVPAGQSVRTGIQDAIGDLSFEFSAGEVPLLSVPVQGAIAPAATVVRKFDFPTLDYGVEATVPPPLTSGVNGIWDDPVIGPTQKCFQTLTIGVDNQIADVQDSCAIDGIRRQEGSPRLLTMSGTMFTNDADFDAEWDSMVDAQTATASYSFRIGTAALGNGDIVEGYTVLVEQLRVTNVEVAQIDNTGLRGITFDARAEALTITFD